MGVVRLIVALVAAGALAWAEDWQKINAGPFEIYTNGDTRAAKILLGTLEQMRGQLGDLIGVSDPRPEWPIRIVIAKGQAPVEPTLTTGVYSVLLAEAQMSRRQKRLILEKILAAVASPLDSGLEDALLSVLSSLDADRTRVTVGAKPEPAGQTRDWVLLEYLITNDNYRGRVRVLLSNLMRGTDQATALRNAFELDEAALRTEADAARAGFGPVSYAARTIWPERDYRARDIEQAVGRWQLAIAQLGNPALRENARKVCATAAAADPEAQACVAVAYELDGKADLAAIEAEKANSLPRMMYLAAVGQPDRLKHQQYLFTLLQLRPLYPAAALAFAGKENDPAKAYKALKDAAGAAQRDSRYLSTLAQWAQKAGLYAEEAKAWAQAERAAKAPEQKQMLREARLGAQDRRYEAEAQARREAEEARLRDIERVRQETLRRVREAEAKARGQLTPLEEGTKVEKWWDGVQPSRYVTGELVRVDCLDGAKARFALREGPGPLVIYEVEDPSKLTVTATGAGNFVFVCGLQKPLKKVKLGIKDKRVLALELLSQ
jgi:hypothetical protein